MVVQCLENCGAKGTVSVSDPRKRSDDRALEKEEEDYFNEDRYESNEFIHMTLLRFSIPQSLSMEICNQ